MAKKKESKSEPYQSHRERLKNTPFDKAEDLKKASHELRQKVWDQLERARIFNELLEKKEYKFIKDEFREGLKCKYGNSPEHLVKVYSIGSGIEVDINRDLVGEISESSAFVETLIRSTSDTFSKSYYKSKGILPSEYSLEEVMSAMQKPKK